MLALLGKVDLYVTQMCLVFTTDKFSTSGSNLSLIYLHVYFPSQDYEPLENKDGFVPFHKFIV